MKTDPLAASAPHASWLREFRRLWHRDGRHGGDMTECMEASCFSLYSAEGAARRADMSAPRFDPTNHHNALACPYCNPDNLSLSKQPPRASVDAVNEHRAQSAIRTSQECEPLASSSAEQQARDMLDRMGVEDAQSFTSGDVIELANLIAASSVPVCPKCGSEDGYLGTSGAYFHCNSCNHRDNYWTSDHQHPGDWAVAILASPHGRKAEVLGMLEFERSKRADAERELAEIKTAAQAVRASGEPQKHGLAQRLAQRLKSLAYDDPHHLAPGFRWVLNDLTQAASVQTDGDPLLLKAEGAICHAKLGGGATCRELYGLDSWCSACVQHALVERLACVKCGRPASICQGEYDIVEGAMIVALKEIDRRDADGREESSLMHAITLACGVGGVTPEQQRESWLEVARIALDLAEEKP